MKFNTKIDYDHSMVDYFEFLVGINEIHKVQYHNEYGGHHCIISLDGEIISGERVIPIIPSKYPQLRDGKMIDLKVGQIEIHHVRLTFHSEWGLLGIIMGCDVSVEIDGQPFRTFKESSKGLFD